MAARDGPKKRMRPQWRAAYRACKEKSIEYPCCEGSSCTEPQSEYLLDGEPRELFHRMEYTLTHTCSKCMTCHKDIERHFPACHPRRSFAVGDRVSVGFQVGWYNGTLQPHPSRGNFVVDFDIKDDNEWVVSLESHSLKPLSETARGWHADVGWLSVGTKLEVQCTEGDNHSYVVVGEVTGYIGADTYRIVRGKGPPEDMNVNGCTPRILQLPRHERVCHETEGWFTFLYWDATRISWTDQASFREVKRTSDSLRLNTIHTPGHPCEGGIGAFASRHLEIGEQYVYAGEVINLPRGHDSQYVAGYGLTDFDVDAACCGNEVRYMNDARGTGKTPNVELRRVNDDATGEVITVAYVIEDVHEGEELLTTYGESGYWARMPEVSGHQSTPSQEEAARLYRKGERVQVKYHLLDGPLPVRWYDADVVSTPSPCRVVVRFLTGEEETLDTSKQFIRVPVVEEIKWPKDIEYISGYKWGPMLKFRHWYSSHAFKPARAIRIGTCSNGTPSLFARRVLQPGDHVVVYSGIVTDKPTNHTAVPLGRGFFVEQCGSEARYVRHCWSGGNVRPVMRHTELTGHLYIDLVATEHIPLRCEIVLDRSGDDSRDKHYNNEKVDNGDDALLGTDSSDTIVGPAIIDVDADEEEEEEERGEDGDSS